MPKLTSDESRALLTPFNLADAHTHQCHSSDEHREIVARLPEIFDEALRCGQNEADVRGATAFLELSAQRSVLPIDWFLPTYSSSVSFEIVANVLRARAACTALIEPVFDNIADILRRVGIPLTPIRLPDSTGYAEKVLKVLNAFDHLSALVLVIPNNPTGHIMSAADLAFVSRVCARRGIVLILDACFRLYDTRTMYDWYDCLCAECDYVVIEDTGKVWPTADLKLSYILASESLRSELRDVHEDILLNVSPFISCLIARYAAFSKRDGLASVRNLIAENRATLAHTLATSGLGWRLTSRSPIGIELLALEHNQSASALATHLQARGISVLPAGAFYWATPEDGDSELRVALARTPAYFADACDALAAEAREWAGAVSV